MGAVHGKDWIYQVLVLSGRTSKRKGGLDAVVSTGVSSVVLKGKTNVTKHEDSVEMSLKGWLVVRVQRSEISDFIEANHYSGSINGCMADYCYGLYNEALESGDAYYKATAGKYTYVYTLKHKSNSHGKNIQAEKG